MMTSRWLPAILLIALGWCGAALADPLTPEARRRPTRALPTADELANPELYHPRPTAPCVPAPHPFPPPPSGVVRPGEFEDADATLFTVINYGPEYFPMWRDAIAALATVGHVWIIADLSAQDLLEPQLFAAGVPTSAYSYLNYPVDSIWIRDYGPEFVVEPDGTRHVIDGQYIESRPLDDAIPGWVAASDWAATDGEPLDLHYHEHRLFTGNIFTDGAGTCFFTYTIYGLEKPAAWTDDDVDQVMADYFGCEQMIVLNPICHDPTGQLNNFAKAVGPTSIVLGEFPPDTHFDGTVYEAGGGHCGDDYPNDYQDLEDNLAIVEATTNLDDEDWQVTRIPMLEPVSSEYDDWIYRTYVSAELSNGVLVMPSYYEPYEGETAGYLLDIEADAIAAFESALAEVEIYTVDVDHLIPLAGALHSIAHEIPAAAGWEPPALYCGDGAITGDEDCDGAALDGVTCEDLGYDGGELACDEHCEYDEADCIGEADTDVDSDIDVDSDADADVDGDSDTGADGDGGDGATPGSPVETRCDCRSIGSEGERRSLHHLLLTSL